LSHLKFLFDEFVCLFVCFQGVFVEVTVDTHTNLEQAIAQAFGANEHMQRIPDTFNRAVMESLKDKGKTLVVWYDINIPPEDRPSPGFVNDIIKHGKVNTCAELCACVFDFTSTNIIGKAGESN
jgi:hypothetical protein